jgi:hypothetical protein
MLSYELVRNSPTYIPYFLAFVKIGTVTILSSTHDCWRNQYLTADNQEILTNKLRKALWNKESNEIVLEIPLLA